MTRSIAASLSAGRSRREPLVSRVAVPYTADQATYSAPGWAAGDGAGAHEFVKD